MSSLRKVTICTSQVSIQVLQAVRRLNLRYFSLAFVFLIRDYMHIDEKGRDTYDYS